MHDYVSDGEVLTGPNKGQHVIIPRIKLAPSDVASPFTLEDPIPYPIGLLHDHQ